MRRARWNVAYGGTGGLSRALSYTQYTELIVSARTDYLLILDQRAKLISSSTFNLDLVASNGVRIPLILPALQFLQPARSFMSPQSFVPGQAWAAPSPVPSAPGQEEGAATCDPPSEKHEDKPSHDASVFVGRLGPT
jgi:hypothetical protein